MIRSSCLCNTKKFLLFKDCLIYKNETTFSSAEGTIIGKCQNCGLLKTFPSNLNDKFDPKQSRGEFYDLSEEKFTELFYPLMILIKKYISSGTILDVGCSSGILVSLLRREKFIVTGIEPNKKAYLKAKNRLSKNIFFGTLQDFVKTNKSGFDCIIYNHVLEHIVNPIKEIELAKSILKKDGIIIVGVPNTRNIIFFLRRKYWESLMPNEHIWHFSDIYLESFFQKHKLNLSDKIYSNHQRSDYPFLKKIYFKSLSFLNKFFNTGESVLMIFKKESGSANI